MLLKGVRPPTDGKIVSQPRPISMITLQASKSHSSKVPKSEQFTHATPSDHDSATPMHTNTVSPFTLESQMTSTLQEQSGPQADRLGTLFESLHLRIAGLEKNSLLHQQSGPNASHDDGDTVRCYSANARGQPLAIRAKKGESNTKGKVHSERGSCVLKKKKLLHTLTHTFG